MADHRGSDGYPADQFRRGLVAHCYRMLGSVREAEGVVRKTYHLAASRYSELATSPYGATQGLRGPDGRAGSWLYGTATRYCLTAAADPRPLPKDLTRPSREPEGKLAERPEVLWLEPAPDHLIDSGRADPSAASGRANPLSTSGRADPLSTSGRADRLVPGSPAGPLVAGGRGGSQYGVGHVGLEFVAALQRLPAEQRAALTLRDVERWPSTAIAEVLETSPFAIDNLIADARDRFDPGPGHLTAADQRLLLERYALAFEQYDVPAIVELFDADAIWEMPPFTSWFRGPRNIGRLISTHCPAEGPGDQVLVPIKANGQPGFAVYMRDPVENVHRAFQIQVLTLTVTGIIHAVAFFDLTLFEAFNLPDLFTSLPDSQADHRQRIHIERSRQHHDNGN